ncbi:hypothetical protein [Hyalangium sp.]|uniref:hypothetical protein n=1 Tax=Hyalangium sp. TaxID=2028555 RepID=UPI002D71D250|nr:hypothetical protein [Hyalangium sp.]HYI03214.1 hypothetical protein [Hyalangium sp.]
MLFSASSSRYQRRRMWIWAVAFFALMGCVLLRVAIHRGPACSTSLPEFEPKVSEIALLWRRRRVRCEHCGIQLQ